MISVPGFLLRRLYVKGSLRNTPRGFQFQLKNSLGSGYAKKLMPLQVDGKELPLDSCFFTVDGKEFAFTAVSEETPFTLALNRTTTVDVAGEPLSKEPHKIVMGFEVRGLGTLRFDFTDSPANDSA